MVARNPRSAAILQTRPSGIHCRDWSGIPSKRRYTLSAGACSGDSPGQSQGECPESPAPVTSSGKIAVESPLALLLGRPSGRSFCSGPRTRNSSMVSSRSPSRGRHGLDAISLSSLSFATRDPGLSRWAELPRSHLMVCFRTSATPATRCTHSVGIPGPSAEVNPLLSPPSAFPVVSAR